MYTCVYMYMYMCLSHAHLLPVNGYHSQGVLAVNIVMIV